MTTISVLGASGMLGAGIVDYFTSRGFEVIEINRQDQAFRETSDHIYFDAMESKAKDLIKKLPAQTTLINCAGLIKHKIDESSYASINEAIKVNTVLPNALAQACETRSIPIYQVVTDCVYSGKSGNYSETNTLDPTDLYGITKAAGEVEHPSTMSIRCSLLGRERKSNFEFLDWVLSHPKDSVIKGFKNHFWNGVTVLDVARFFEGAITTKFHLPGTYHFIPSDSVSKYELMKIVCEEFRRKDLTVNEAEAAIAINRVLTTINPQLNIEMWKIAQYNQIPSVSTIISNYANWIYQDRGK